MFKLVSSLHLRLQQFIIVSNDFPPSKVTFYVHSFARIPKRAHYISGIQVKGVKTSAKFLNQDCCVLF
jgi:hypothetical protein